ncbi:hypothetical protein ACH4SK_16215 [Streptomyces inhibens]|uniref:hypothetical protein n=1 Tax=Streptomyces inhibens TaxID=2293571 RepID=UPI00378B9BD2
MTVSVAVVLAVVAAWCFASAARLQHHAVHTSASGCPPRVPRGIGLIRDRRRMWGWLLLGAGGVLHAAALALAPLAVVQPLGVLAVPITAVRSARDHGRVSQRPAWPAIVVTIVGASSFAVLSANEVDSGGVPPWAEMRTGLLVFAVVALCAAAGVRRSARVNPRVRGLAFATGAGACFGLVPVLVHAASQRVAAEGVGTAVVADALAVVLALVAGGWFVQRAYAHGPPEVAMACLTVVDPIIAVGTGLALFGEGFGSAGAVAAAAGCAALALSGVVALTLARPASPPAGSRPASDENTSTHRSKPCPKPPSTLPCRPPLCGSSSAPTPIHRTSMGRPTSHTASPTASPDGATTST